MSATPLVSRYLNPLPLRRESFSPEHQAESFALRPAQTHLIWDIAQKSFAEIAISLSLGTLAFLFTATSLQGALIFAAIGVQTLCNGILRYVEGAAAADPDCFSKRRIISTSQYLRPIIFGYLSAINGQILLHEAGHALAATWMFKRANPQITIRPCFGGSTRFNPSHLTCWGELMGKGGALLFVSLMGPACTLIVSSVAILTGLAVKKKFPELGSYLVSVGTGDFYAHASYALSAFFAPPGSSMAHDFVRLKSYGISPFAAAIPLFAAPFLMKWAMSKKEEQPITQIAAS